MFQAMMTRKASRKRRSIAVLFLAFALLGFIFLIMAVVGAFHNRSIKQNNTNGAQGLRLDTKADSKYAAFANREELIRAVDVYLLNDDRMFALVRTYGPLPDWNVSLVTNFGGIFSVLRNPLASSFSGNVSAWDVSQATHLHDMFQFAGSFNGDLSHWKVDKVQYFNSMFEGCSNFQGIGLERWRVSNGRLFMAMFSDVNSLSPLLDLRSWNLWQATSTKAMFRNSSFGSLSPYNDVCSWRQQLKADVDAFAMFLDSNCPQAQGETSLDPTRSANFCVACPASQTDWEFTGINSAQTELPTTLIFSTEAPTDEFEDPNGGILSAQTQVPSEIVEETTGTPTQTPTGDKTTTGGTSSPTVNRPNILFLMTDQQRFDTIRLVQNELWYYSNVTKIKTPNLDKLAKSGAYFRQAYCQCPVCAPSRATLRTGCTVERTGIQHNDLISEHEYSRSDLFKERIESAKGLDEILGQAGYVSEYYGKWHLPTAWWGPVRANDYDYDRDAPTFTSDSVSRKTRRFLDYHEAQGRISRDMEDGMQRDIFTGWPYTPIPLDPRHGMPTNTGLATSQGFKGWQTTQPNVLGENKLDANYTNTFFIADMALKALDRLLDGPDPFFMTVSFHNPHPPMTPATKHYEFYRQRKESLFVSHNLYDDLINTDYGSISSVEPKYKDRKNIQEWTALYYALITEIDEWVGVLLDKLGDQIDNTLVVFTSDHGEMLGAHGKREKNNFFEEAARVPLLMSFPGVISRDTVVAQTVSHLDLVSTILDYAELAHEDQSDGKSLRPLVEGQSYNAEYDESIAVTEWDYRKPLPSNAAVLERRIDERPALMIRKGPYKLMTHKLASSPEIDMLYDLNSDPFELHNLVGLNALSASPKTLQVAEYLRCLLLEWMERMDGSGEYYSHPLANYGQGIGDIEELRLRQSWPALDFWSSHPDSIEFGKPAWNGTHYVRNEYLYLGTRTPGTTTVDLVYLVDSDASLFSLSNFPGSISFSQGECVRIQISFASTSLPRDNVDTSINIVRKGATTTLPISFQNGS